MSDEARCPVCATDALPDGDRCPDCGFDGRCHQCDEETFADLGDPNYCSDGCRRAALDQAHADTYV